MTGSSTALYLTYKGWCTENGLNALGSGKFEDELLMRPGIRKVEWSETRPGVKRRTYRGVSGLRIRSEDWPDEPDDLTPAAASPPQRPDESTSAAPQTNGHAPKWEDEPSTDDRIKVFTQELQLPLNVATDLAQAFATAKEIADASDDELKAARPKLTAAGINEIRHRAQKACE
jgi:hypothetical protein